MKDEKADTVSKVAKKDRREATQGVAPSRVTNEAVKKVADRMKDNR
jgi:hypothetical protein